MKQGMLSRAIRSSDLEELEEVSKYELRSCAENSSWGHLKLVVAVQMSDRMDAIIPQEVGVVNHDTFIIGLIIYSKGLILYDDSPG